MLSHQFFVIMHYMGSRDLMERHRVYVQQELLKHVHVGLNGIRAILF